MGGHADGAVAAKLARDEVGKRILGILRERLSLQDLQERVRQALIEANKVVYEEARKRGSDMGTTATVALIWKEPNGKMKLIVVNVGDSRVYLLRKGQRREGQQTEGQLELLTLDDGIVRQYYKE